MDKKQANFIKSMIVFAKVVIFYNGTLIILMTVGYFSDVRIDPQAHGYRCSFHLRVSQTILKVIECEGICVH
jgi:hypothetical protein